jgi:hypothetical protein
MATQRPKKLSSRSSSAEKLELVERQLRQLEDEWMAARIRNEAQSTEALLDDNYHGGTSSGIPQTKEDFVKTVSASRKIFDDFEYTERVIKIHGHTAVSTGVLRLWSPAKQHSFRYLRAYLKRANKWRLIASQSTALKI